LGIGRIGLGARELKRTRENGMAEEIPKRDLTKFVLKMVGVMRGQAQGLISSPQYKDWTKEELEGTANLMLEDLWEQNPEAMERLRQLYRETNGEPFKEVWYAE